MIEVSHSLCNITTQGRRILRQTGANTHLLLPPDSLLVNHYLHARNLDHGGDLAEDVVTIIGSAIDL
ncbi:hypothetical protein MJO28_010709 [Puccinia striiformis f. sp. tritici]|uniref:Uncharacterized protein n=1 Tax=Puccinia striiformis f. sp. tritici TaxID=168172 RepID=A0ACC0E585_9BASI|nr:hypothetical protein MJO28_010709 [Puccinia striiformis f. sp. tritici]